MATLLYVVVDPAAERAALGQRRATRRRCCSTTDGRREFLEGGSSVPLGVLPFPEFEEASVAIEPGRDGRALHGRPGRAAGRAHRRRRSTGWPTRCAGTRPIPQQLCDRVLRELVPGGRRARRRGAADAAHDPDGRPLRGRAADRARGARRRCARVLRRWLRHVDGSRAGDRRGRDRVRRGRDQRHRARRRRATFRSRSAARLDGPHASRSRCATAAPGGRRARATAAAGSRSCEALMDSVEVAPTPEGTTVRMQRTLLDARVNGDRR